MIRLSMLVAAALFALWVAGCSSDSSQMPPRTSADEIAYPAFILFYTDN